jgi:hypothetical protein
MVNLRSRTRSTEPTSSSRPPATLHKSAPPAARVVLHAHACRPSRWHARFAGLSVPRSNPRPSAPVSARIVTKSITAVMTARSSPSALARNVSSSTSPDRGRRLYQRRQRARPLTKSGGDEPAPDPLWSVVRRLRRGHRSGASTLYYRSRTEPGLMAGEHRVTGDAGDGCAGGSWSGGRGPGVCRADGLLRRVSASARSGPLGATAGSVESCCRVCMPRGAIGPVSSTRKAARWCCGA